MEILDIGGGFSGGTGCGSKELEPVAAAINAALDAWFPAECGGRVIAEPGRYFSEAAATLATPIFGRRRRRGASGEEFDYWVTDGVYGSMNCLLYDHAKISTRPLHVASAGGGGKRAVHCLRSDLRWPGHRPAGRPAAPPRERRLAALPLDGRLHRLGRLQLQRHEHDRPRRLLRAVLERLRLSAARATEAVGAREAAAGGIIINP